MKKSVLIVGALMAGLAGIVGGCDDSSGSGGTGGTGTSGSTSSKTGSTSSSSSTTAATTAASTTTGGMTSSSSGASGCTVLDPGMVMKFTDGDMQDGLASAPPLADAQKPDEFDILFYGSPYIAMTGTFDLASAGANDNYATCSQCIYIFQDVDNMDVEDKFFFQSEGTMTISDTDLIDANVSAGTLKDVKLVESTVDPSTYISTPVPNGACYIIPSYSWDTKP
jgi:hypothetical protein